MKNYFSKKKILALLILAAAAGICMVFGFWMPKERNMYGIYGLSFEREDKFFAPDDLEKIEKEGIAFTYKQQIYPDVSNGFRMENISVFLTNENYAYFTNAYMQEGAFFNGAQADRKLPVMVVSKAAAFQLFGNCRCVGETVYLNQAPYKIIGIMAGRSAKEAELYIPYSAAGFLGITDLEIRQIWCRFSNKLQAAIARKISGSRLSCRRLLMLTKSAGINFELFKTIFLPRCYT